MFGAGGLKRDALVMILAAATTGLGVVGVRTVQATYARRLPPGTPVGDTRRLLDAAHFIGPRAAKRVIVEFSDFQCPYCREAQTGLTRALATYGPDVAIAFLNKPLPHLHAHATRAALGAICADGQGVFRAYHDYMFANQDSIGTTAWDDVADRVGVKDTAGFRRCMTSADAASRLAREDGLSRQLRVDATPMFVVDGRLYSNMPAPVFARVLAKRWGE